MVLLEDLLSAEDFGAAVNGLACEFRNRHELPAIHQLGLVVSDVEEAAHALEDRGIGPFFMAGGSPVLWRERGEERSVRGKIGLTYHQGFELELLEPGDGSDFYRQSLDPEGKIVVQHLGFLVRDVDEWAEKLSASGTRVWIRGTIKAGPSKTEFAYMDTLDETGLIIEFISWGMFGWKFKSPAGILKAVWKLWKLKAGS
jgi:hypothetical protein